MGSDRANAYTEGQMNTYYKAHPEVEFIILQQGSGGVTSWWPVKNFLKIIWDVKCTSGRVSSEQTIWNVKTNKNVHMSIKERKLMAGERKNKKHMAEYQLRAIAKDLEIEWEPKFSAFMNYIDLIPDRWPYYPHYEKQFLNQWETMNANVSVPVS